MVGTILSGVLILFFLGLLPMAVGSIVNKNGGIGYSYSIGFLSLMALCEIIAVPCILLKLSFTCVMVGYFIAVIAFIIFGVVRDKKRIVNNVIATKNYFKTFGKVDYICLLLVMGLLGVIIVNSVRLYVADADDSRFVVTAADIIRTNTLFLADPNTGVVYDTWAYGVDASKDIIAPHAVFCAVLSRITATNVTLLMHNVYPIFLYVLAVCVYYNLISELIESNERLKCDKYKEAYKHFALFVILLYTIFQYSTRNTRETVFLVRIWQGKAILAGIIIPAMLWTFYKIYRDGKKDSYLLLFMVSLSGCLTSSMSTLIMPLMIGCYGLVYGICKKNIKTTLGIWSCSIVPILLALLSMHIRNEMILCY